MEQTPTKVRKEKKTGIIIMSICTAILIASAVFVYFEYIKKPNSNYTSQINKEFETITIPFGIEGKLATISVKVHGYKKVQTIHDYLFGTTVSKEKTSFFLVDVSVTNISNNSFMFNPDGIYLINKEGIRYNTYQISSGGSIGLEKTAIDGRDLGYQVEERGNLVYEISDNFIPYAVAIEKADSNEVLLFELN